MGELLAELIAFLAHRQSATESLVAEQVHRAHARADQAARHYAQFFERADRIDRRLARLAEQVEQLRAITTSLKTTVLATPTVAAARLPAPNGYVAPNGLVGPVPLRKVLLRVENLAKEIGGADILAEINFEIYENEILGLIGPNGAGKTTLMECLANLRPRTSGTFYEGDEAPPDWDPKRLMFYLPNGVAPYAELYTIQVLTLFGKLFEVEPRRWEQIILRELELAPVLQKKVGALSKGNLQRLLIALALMSPQPLLALDEPFDGLDVHQTQAMMGMVRGLRERSRTLLLCIHQLNDAERICDRPLLLSGGRMVGIGTLAELRAQAGLSEGNLEAIFLALTSSTSAHGVPTSN